MPSRKLKPPTKTQILTGFFNFQKIVHKLLLYLQLLERNILKTYVNIPIATLVGSGSHTHTFSGTGHPKVDFPNATLPSAALNIFPAAIAANIRNSAAPIQYISWRLAPSAVFGGFPACKAAFGGANRRKRRRVNYTINRGFSHLASTSMLLKMMMLDDARKTV